MSSQPWSGSHAQGFFRLFFSREMFPIATGRSVSRRTRAALPWASLWGQPTGKRGAGSPCSLRAASGRDGGSVSPEPFLGWNGQPGTETSPRAPEARSRRTWAPPLWVHRSACA